VRLDRLGVSPREDATEFDSVNQPVVAGLRDPRSLSSSRGVAGFLCTPIADFPILGSRVAGGAMLGRRSTGAARAAAQRGYRTGVATPLSFTTSACILFSSVSKACGGSFASIARRALMLFWIIEKTLNSSL